ncbi:MAG: adenylyltransferase/cytidyltransferase family protein [Candidatus Buchananbacteria bacterium]|nr:adenylyltransferase/cytidyltransferase family protein [Candidatus Buchananbacteria bacterium]
MKAKILLDYDELKKFVEAHKTLQQKVVCTIGSWDMLHIGHLRYLINAKNKGDILIVGTDSDAAIKRYKNEYRPIIPQDERMEMLSYQDCVDYITLIDDVDEKGAWNYELLKIIQPDIYVCIDESYPEEQKQNIRKYVNELIELPRQAEKTSTTDIIEKTFKSHLAQINNIIKEKKQ